MYAVIETGGKQYRIAKDDVISVEKLETEAGKTVEFQALMVGEGASVTVGTPHVAGARVTAEVVEQARTPKVIVFKKQRRKNHRRKKGHRQHITKLRITEIVAA